MFDIVNGDRQRVEVALSDGRPMKGAGNLLRACREDIELISADGRSVVAVFDDDKIRGQLRLPPKSSAERVREEICRGCVAPKLLDIVLLERNMETVVEAAGKCSPAFERERIELAVRDKTLIERDAILTSCSRERERPARDCIRKRVPSFAGLVELLCQRLRSAWKGPDRRNRGAG